MNRTDYYSIGEVASTCNISIRTLRYYDEISLVVPEIRKEGSKYRYYSKDQMVNILIIRKLRCLGIGLKEIKEIVSTNNLDVMKGSVTERLDDIHKEIVELERSQREGEVLLRRLEEGSEIISMRDDPRLASGSLPDEIKIEKVPKIHIYYSRKVMKAYHNEEVSLDRWAGIGDEVREHGLKSSGPIIVTYHTDLLDQFLSKTCDIEFGTLTRFAILADSWQSRFFILVHIMILSKPMSKHCSGSIRTIIKSVARFQKNLLFRLSM